MNTVSASEAKTHLGRLLERVVNGETIAITRNGVPVALLVPPPSAATPDVRAAIARLKALRRNRESGGATARELSELIQEGRR